MEQTSPYVFAYRNIDPAKLRPIGDRYLIQVLDVDEEMVNGLYLPDTTEEQRGWCVGVVFAVGNGHRLDTPDIPVMLPSVPAEEFLDIPREATARERKHAIAKALSGTLGYDTPACSEQGAIKRVYATVPMMFGPGEVIFVERYSGRKFTIRGREYRFVNQVDCLGSTGVWLRPLDNGASWEERDLEAERQASEAEHKSAATNGKYRLT